MSFLVLKFVCDNSMSEYQVVPEHWFNDDQCWWPLDFTKKKTIHLITTYTVPDETTWQKYSAGSYGKIQLVKQYSWCFGTNVRKFISSRFRTRVLQSSKGTSKASRSRSWYWWQHWTLIDKHNCDYFLKRRKTKNKFKMIVLQLVQHWKWP